MTVVSRRSLIVGRVLPSPSLVEGGAPAAVEVARRSEVAAVHLARVAASADVAEVYGALVDLFISTSPDRARAGLLVGEALGGAAEEASVSGQRLDQIEALLGGGVRHEAEPRAHSGQLLS